MIRIFTVLSLLLVTACASTPRTVPTSERLEAIRAQKAPTLTAELEAQKLALGAPVFIRVFKKENILETWVKPEDSAAFVPFKRYKVCKYSGGLGPKLREGDFQSPEGFYEVGADQLNPWSQYHLSFDVGFPNTYDRKHKRTGSHLMIHGDCKSEGCYAMTDKNIEEIYLLVEASIANGADVPVHIFPFKMTATNLVRYNDLGWGPFWRNLREGYDAFELTNIPPDIIEGTGHERFKYVFEDQQKNYSYLHRVGR